MDWKFQVDQEDRIVGRNAECADLDNPHGHIFRRVYFVTARNDYGRIYAHFWTTEDPAEAEQWAKWMAADVRSNPQWTPEDGNPYWTFLRNCYGSQAYQDDGDEAATVAWERGNCLN